MKTLLRLTAVCSVLLVVFLVVAVFAGPAASGGLLLLLPAFHRSSPHDLRENYTPLHNGYVGTEIGLYSRDNDDLFVPGTPGARPATTLRLELPRPARLAWAQRRQPIGS